MISNPAEGAILQMMPASGTVKFLWDDASREIVPTQMIGYGLVVTDKTLGVIHTSVEPIVIVQGQPIAAGAVFRLFSKEDRPSGYHVIHYEEA